jgi:hypothetical protein
MVLSWGDEPAMCKVMMEEMTSIEQNTTCGCLSTYLQDIMQLAWRGSSSWSMTNKGPIVKHKAQLVAKGYVQR